MPDGGADVSIKPDELRALKPRLEEIKAAIELMGEHLGKNQTVPAQFGGADNAPAAAAFFIEQRDLLVDTSMATNFVQAFIDAVEDAASGSEETEKELSDKFKKIHGGG